MEKKKAKENEHDFFKIYVKSLEETKFPLLVSRSFLVEDLKQLILKVFF